MAIGNAPWPIGVTNAGIHARPGRERIFSKHVAHVLNDEFQRKYIQVQNIYIFYHFIILWNIKIGICFSIELSLLIKGWFFFRLHQLEKRLFLLISYVWPQLPLKQGFTRKIIRINVSYLSIILRFRTSTLIFNPKELYFG